MADDRRTVAVDELFRDHAGFVASFLHRLGVRDCDIDDVVQQVFLVAHQKGGYTEGPAAARTWLAAIAVRLAKASHRAVHQLRRREDYNQAALDAAVSVGKTPEEAVQIRDSMWRVERALATLDLDHRAVFVLFEIEGLSCGEIATTLDVPTGTVYSRLHHARRRFSAAHDKIVCAERAHGKKGAA